jgi:hypothetical protein
MTPGLATRMPRKVALLLAGMLLLSFVYFYQAGGWNQNSRFALVRAIVEQHTLRIDSYAASTGDRAQVGHHFYSDKAPGQALLAVPVVAALRPLGVHSASALSYAATVATAALPTMLTALCLVWLALGLGATRWGAILAALAFALGSPAWAYATLLWGYALSTCGLLAAFSCAAALGRSTSLRRDLLLGLGVGLAAGWAVVSEYPAAPPAVIVSGLALAKVWPAGWRRRLPVVGGIAIGALACVAVLLIYQQAAFGSPFDAGYRHVQGFTGMQQGMMGITYPKAHVIHEILFGRFRGLLPLAPALAAGPVGLVLCWRRGRRAEVISALLVILYYLTLNAAYVYWNGGWSYGPRHLAPALPFLALGLAFLWQRLRPLLRVLLVAAVLWGIGSSLVAVSTTAQPPEAFDRPVAQLLWPAFKSGDLSLNHESFDESGADPRRLRGHTLPHDAWNLGEKLGLRGLPSLVPLLLAWLAAIGMAAWVERRRQAPPPAGSTRRPGEDQQTPPGEADECVTSPRT